MKPLRIKSKNIGYGNILLQVNGTTLQMITRVRRGIHTYYSSDTFSGYYSSVDEAKEETARRAEDGYFGEAFKAVRYKEKQKAS